MIAEQSGGNGSAAQIRKGENRSIPTELVQVSVRWTRTSDFDADLSALLLKGRKVRSDEDFIFYNQTSSADGTVEHRGKQSNGSVIEDRIAANLPTIAPDVESVLVALSVDPGHRVAELGAVAISVMTTQGVTLATFSLTDMTVETAAIAVELYRRNGSWKLRAVGQGYIGGLAALVRDFGVTVDDEPPPDSLKSDTPAQTEKGEESNPPEVKHYEPSSLPDRVLDSAIFRGQLSLAGRVVVTGTQITKLLQILLDAGGNEITIDQAAEILGVAPTSVNGALMQTKRILDVEGYEVLRVRDGVVGLDVSALREQFGID